MNFLASLISLHRKKNIGINELGNELSYMAENRGKTAIYKLDALCPDEWNREYTA